MTTVSKPRGGAPFDPLFSGAVSALNCETALELGDRAGALVHLRRLRANLARIADPHGASTELTLLRAHEARLSRHLEGGEPSKGVPERGATLEAAE